MDDDIFRVLLKSITLFLSLVYYINFILDKHFAKQLEVLPILIV